MKVIVGGGTETGISRIWKLRKLPNNKWEKRVLKQYCTLNEFSVTKNHLLSEQQVAKKEW